MFGNKIVYKNMHDNNVDKEYANILIWKTHKHAPIARTHVRTHACMHANKYLWKLFSQLENSRDLHWTWERFAFLPARSAPLMISVQLTRFIFSSLLDSICFSIHSSKLTIGSLCNFLFSSTFVVDIITSGRNNKYTINSSFSSKSKIITFFVDTAAIWK